jgi:hypothetical protein
MIRYVAEHRQTGVTAACALGTRIGPPPEVAAQRADRIPSGCIGQECFSSSLPCRPKPQRSLAIRTAV